jgi:hypothetical protein
LAGSAVDEKESVMFVARVRPVGLLTVLIVGALLIASATAWRVGAAPSSTESTFVAVSPERILDTRDPIDVGLDGPFVSGVSQKLGVVGVVATSAGPREVVPAGATGVALNVTVVGPSAAGFVSIRPGDATGAPSTSSLNFEAGVVQPNAVTVELPTSGANAGAIDITFDAYGAVGPTTDLLIDVVGYTTNVGIQSLVADLATKANAADVYTKTEVYTKGQVDAALAPKANAADVYTKGQVDAALAPKANAADVYTKTEVYTTGQVDAALATKAEIDDVRRALLADKTWVAAVEESGAKLFTGPFTSKKNAVGSYQVSFSVAGFQIPTSGVGFPFPVITTACPGTIASRGALLLVSSSGIVQSFTVDYSVRNTSGTAVDCAATVHVKFTDPDSGSPVPPFFESADEPPAGLSEGASCITEGEETICTVMPG